MTKLTKTGNRMITGSPVCILDYIPAVEHDAIAAGVSTYNCTTGFRQAVLDCQIGGKTLYLPAGLYRLTGTINITRGFTIVGDGAEHTADNVNATNTFIRGRGTWLHFDHPGIGISAAPAAGAGNGKFSGLCIKHLGTFRTQPTPGPGWVPGSYDWDFQVLGDSCLFEDILIFGSYKGIRLWGRVECNRVCGQTFGPEGMIFLEFCADTPRLNDCHYWPFWSVNDHVRSYMAQNSVAYALARSDNCSMVGCFSIWAHTAVKCFQISPAFPYHLPPYNLRIVNCDFDGCGAYGIFVHSNADRCAMSISNTSIQHLWSSESGVTDGASIHVEGTNTQIRIANLICGYALTSAIRIRGSGNYTTATNVRVDSWNMQNFSYAAFDASAGNTLQLLGMPQLAEGNGARLLGGAGAFRGLSVAGDLTTNTDGSGYCTITHDLGVAATAVMLTPRDADPVTPKMYHAQVYGNTATATVVQIIQSTGAPMASSVVRLNYVLHY